MKKLFLYFSFFFIFLNMEGKSGEISPIKQNFEEVFNIGKMISHDEKFTLYFRTRKKLIRLYFPSHSEVCSFFNAS